MLKDALTKKMGPLPAYAWVLAIVGGLLVARYLRAQSASKTDTSSTDTSSTDTTSTDAAKTLASGTDIGLTGALPNQVQGGFVDPINEAQTGALFDQLGNALSILTDLAGNIRDGFGAGPNTDTQQPSLDPNNVTSPVGGDGAPPASNPPVSRAPAAQSNQGVIVKQVKLKNGATLTTFADGRVEEKMPGKSAYVVKRANKAPTRFVTPHFLAIADAPVGYGVFAGEGGGTSQVAASRSLTSVSSDASPALVSDTTPLPIIGMSAFGSPLDAPTAAAAAGIWLVSGGPDGIPTSRSGQPVLEHSAGIPVLVNQSGSPDDRQAAYDAAHPAVRSTAYSPAMAPAVAAPVAAAGHSVAMEAAAPLPTPGHNVPV